MDVRVTFDPCALRSHWWKPATLGLAALVGAEQCRWCGETRIPASSKNIDINRTENEHWRAYQRST